MADASLGSWFSWWCFEVLRAPWHRAGEVVPSTSSASEAHEHLWGFNVTLSLGEWRGVFACHEPQVVIAVLPLTAMTVQISWRVAWKLHQPILFFRTLGCISSGATDLCTFRFLRWS